MPPRPRACSPWAPGNGQSRQSCWEKHQAAPGSTGQSLTAYHREAAEKEHLLGPVFQEDSLSHGVNVTPGHASQHLLLLLPTALRREVRNLSFAL